MYSKSVLVLALACFGASAAPFGSTVGICGPTVSETLVTPFHRTDAYTTPCARSILHTTYNLGSGANFLGGAGGIQNVGLTGHGLYPGTLGSGTTVGLYPTAVGGGFAGASQGVGFAGAYPASVGQFNLGAFRGTGAFPGFAGSGVTGCGVGIYPGTTTVV